MANSSLSEIEEEAINIVNGEVTAHEDATSFVTDRVAFRMRNLIRTLLKNYWGIYDIPQDPVTRQKKIWIPLTRNVVDTAIKSIDLDSKDINFRARTRQGIPVTNIVRAFFRRWMDSNFFGEFLNDINVQMCITGTAVAKIWTTKEGDKTIIHKKMVDILNVYIDPTSNNIQSAYRFTERALLDPETVQGMTGWTDTSNLKTTEGLNPTDPKLDTVAGTKNKSKSVEAYEMWGKIPNWLLTGKTKDKEKDMEEIDGHIVVSGIRGGQDQRVHLIEKNTTKDKEGNIIKPYEEFRYTKVPGRWYGVGPAEMVLMLQTWVNVTDNIRITRNRVAQLGLFKIKRGSGITPQMVGRLASNGALLVKDMGDIEQFVMQEAGVTSYRDEEVAVDWAQKITSATDVISGGDLPASSTATSAVIQERNAKSTFVLVRENYGLSLQKLIDRHMLKDVAEQIKKGDVVRIYGDVDNIKQLRERVASFLTLRELEDSISKGKLPTDQEIQSSIQSAIGQLEDDGELFIEVLEEIIVQDMDTQIFVTNEEFNPAVVADKIITTMQIAPELREHLLPQLTDILGLEAPRIQAQAQPQKIPAGVENPLQGQTEQQLTTQAVASV